MLLKANNNKLMPQKILKQQDNQTCLICCLLMSYGVLTGKSIDFALIEKKLHAGLFGLYQESFVLSCLAAFIKRFKKVKAVLWLDSLEYTRELSRQNQEQRIIIKHQLINAWWLKKQLIKSQLPVLVFIDALHLGCPVHMQHWIYLAVYNAAKGFIIIDTGPGKKRIVKENQLTDAILGLKYQMLWSPAAITLENIKLE